MNIVGKDTVLFTASMTALGIFTQAVWEISEEIIEYVTPRKRNYYVRVETDDSHVEVCEGCGVLMRCEVCGVDEVCKVCGVDKVPATKPGENISN